MKTSHNKVPVANSLSNKFTDFSCPHGSPVRRHKYGLLLPDYDRITGRMEDARQAASTLRMPAQPDANHQHYSGNNDLDPQGHRTQQQHDATQCHHDNRENLRSSRHSTMISPPPNSRSMSRMLEKPLFKPWPALATRPGSCNQKRHGGQYGQHDACQTQCHAAQRKRSPENENKGILHTISSSNNTMTNQTPFYEDAPTPLRGYPGRTPHQYRRACDVSGVQQYRLEEL